LITSPYLDIHTHGRLPLEGTATVGSLSIEELKQQMLPGKYASAGIHPWWLEDYTVAEIAALKVDIEALLKQQKLWAIGETGIDRSYPETLDEQLKLFGWHFDLAEKYQLPLIAHNVRAGSDFLSFIKQSRPSTAWIFHDFRGNQELVSKLLQLHPDCYFSFGISVDNSPQVRELLPTIPLERLFLETDNQKHLDIHDIYLRTAEVLGMDLEFLKAQIWLNFRRLGPI
jgi:TatD DNase family protein